MIEFLKKVKKSKNDLLILTNKEKNNVLEQMAKNLIKYTKDIMVANNKDIANANTNNLNSALKDRLLLTNERIKDMSDAIIQITKLPDPTNRILDGFTTNLGLEIHKVSVPIGVIGMIYESRPNVTSDVAALCFKSGNACILKGGKEAIFSNEAIIKVIKKTLQDNNINENVISLVPDYSRESVAKLIKMDNFVDLIIPRGGESLIKYINENSSIPVIKHDKGLCHVYIDKYANFDKAISISINAKTQRVGVCNAMESLLVHQDIAKDILPKLQKAFNEKKTLLKGCQKTRDIINVELANEEDFHTEYLDNILSIKVVTDIKDAISHIEFYGSKHSDSIVSENITNINKFLSLVDSACVYANASTRFTDGSIFELGAEVGISTSKLHARGPMGIKDLTTYKFKIYGDGTIR
jgi:glutamate-5-semialdehyde dehydrogenase